MANPHAATPQEMFDLVSGRRTDEPDPVRAAVLAELGGATESAQADAEATANTQNVEQVVGDG